ncbi:MAG TPA: hypothetical protein VLW85_00120 [Myxococcales bacterium]|nr:hypothetical protein [Myxococcales bacterium]
MGPRNRLYGVPPAEFTRARDALAKELRAGGKDAEAKEVAALRKPAAALWIANQLAKAAPRAVKALIDAAGRMKRAHQHGDSDALRAAMQEQREALGEIGAAAEKAAAAIGSKPTMDLLRRVQSTAQSAAAAEPEKLREGELDEELEPSGFESLLGTHIGAPKHHSEAKPAEPADDHRRREHAARELKKAEHDAEKLAAEAKERKTAAVEAQEAATEARRAADEARRRANEAAAHALSLRRKG